MVIFDNKNNKLIIEMHETAPEEARDRLIKAIAAIMRWEASCPDGDKYNEDGFNKYTLARLLEELVNE